MGPEDGKVSFRLWLRCLQYTQAVWSTAIGVVVLGLESALQEGEIRESCPLYQTMGRLCLCGERLKSGSRGNRPHAREHLHLRGTRGFKRVGEGAVKQFSKENPEKEINGINYQTNGFGQQCQVLQTW